MKAHPAIDQFRENFRSLSKFIVVGFINTVICLAFIFTLISFFGVDYRVANFLGYIIGYIMSFIANRQWTFQHSGCWKKAFFRWSIVALASYLTNLSIVILVHSKMGFNVYGAQFLGVFVYTGVSFLGGRFFAFSAVPSR